MTLKTEELLPWPLQPVSMVKRYWTATLENTTRESSPPVSLTLIHWSEFRRHFRSCRVYRVSDTGSVHLPKGFAKVYLAKYVNRLEPNEASGRANG